MQVNQLDNASGANQVFTTHVSGVDRDGTPLDYPAMIGLFRTNAAISRGHGVGWVDPTATNPASVAPFTVAGTDLEFAGVAMEAASGAGKYIKVCLFGFCLVWMNAQVSAAGEVLLNPTTTAGELIRAADPTHDATLVSASILGRVFGIKNATTNLALCFIRQV